MIVKIVGILNNKKKIKMKRKPKRYWSDETILKELKSIIKEINHFPTKDDLKLIAKNGLRGAISKNGGFIKFRLLLGYDLTKKPNGYWSEESVINEIKAVINDIGHFPTQKELKLIQKSGLMSAIRIFGGINKFRTFLGYVLKRNSDGHWTDEIIVKELKLIIKEIGHFPSVCDLKSINKSKLASAIITHGGYPKFQELCGHHVSLNDKYVSELHSYVGKRGKKSEKLVNKIISEYCTKHGFSLPSLNIKLIRGSIIEFVCNTKKKIGIDVTNTNSKSAVYRKWTHKQYHKHLDELWIVVFGTFTEQDYIKWNSECPSNVKVFSIYGFLKELDYSLDEYTRNKIDKYCKCTFHSKDDLITIRPINHIKPMMVIEIIP